ncbi:hypothetical protein HYFRA_00010158 [Hymenoscyphus fraxineus]|uniref:Uncharacterized protein n=1 Tax=Hymenoscyphus fraxineus TaxID=746836 RepID=A0A9N9KTX8_9HELO|nr:hypothetical protein HYFRA_00010158 [Hymenoscyphus fraxineus]
MAPPTELFPTSQLPLRSQTSLTGTKRKGFNGDLKTCELLEMLQYSCEVSGGGRTERNREQKVRCWPVERFFRRCHDQKGSFTVETTTWEGAEKGFKSP